MPEPTNPFDRSAVGLEIDGRAVGHMSRGYAAFWHPVVAAFNKRGYHVLASARLVHEDGHPNFVVSLPHRRQLSAIVLESGAAEGFEALWTALPEETRLALMNDPKYAAPVHWGRLRALAPLMPHLVWDRESGASAPWVVMELIEAKAKAWLKERLAELAAERTCQRAQVVALHEQGLRFKEIGERLGMSTSKAAWLFHWHGR